MIELLTVFLDKTGKILDLILLILIVLNILIILFYYFADRDKVVDSFFIDIIILTLLRTVIK